MWGVSPRQSVTNLVYCCSFGLLFLLFHDEVVLSDHPLLEEWRLSGLRHPRRQSSDENVRLAMVIILRKEKESLEIGGFFFAYAE